MCEVEVLWRHVTWVSWRSVEARDMCEVEVLWRHVTCVRWRFCGGT